MSNADARLARTLSPSGRKPFDVGGRSRRWALADSETRKRLLVAAIRFAGDIASCSLAIVLVAMTAVAATGRIDLADRLHLEMWLLLLLLLGTNCLVGLYRTNVRDPLERFRLRATAALLFVFAGVLMGLRARSMVELAMVPGVAAVALLLGVWIEHLVYALLLKSGIYRAPAVILGSGTAGRALARLLINRPRSGLRPIGFIDDGTSPGDTVDESAPRKAAGDTVDALPVLGTLDGWYADGRAEVAIVPDCSCLPPSPAALYRLGLRQVLIVTRLGDFPAFGLQVRNADCFVAVELNGQSSGYSRQLKRSIDLAIASILLLLTAPLIGLFAIAIKLVDPGPAFYGQWRIGQFGRPIRISKLRTMYNDAEQRLARSLETDPDLRKQWQQHFKLDKDERILPYVGRLMRRASLDELPQLWNVIRGNMSLVGPRPFPDYHVNAFDPEFRELRASVPPGLTGLWQISSRSDGDLDAQRAEDSFYIRNQSLWLDLYILIATLPAVVAAKGAR